VRIRSRVGTASNFFTGRGTHPSDASDARCQALPIGETCRHEKPQCSLNCQDSRYAREDLQEEYDTSISLLELYCCSIT
jgi:hypothetical protein